MPPPKTLRVVLLGIVYASAYEAHVLSCKPNTHPARGSPSHTASPLHELRLNYQGEGVWNDVYGLSFEGSAGVRHIPDEAIDRRCDTIGNQASFERAEARGTPGFGCGDGHRSSGSGMMRIE
jgi:hypothetical protein